MKNAVVGMAILVSLIWALSAHAADRAPGSESRAYWAKVAKLIEQCAVQPYATRPDGTKVYTALRSVCSELQAGATDAKFQVDGETFTAHLSESADADGGDLNDLQILNARGEVVAQRQNVPAFGDVLLALAGGNPVAREILDPSVLH